MNVITRFPPSPTGYLHIGRARTALFNFLFAKHHKGKMILRIEDTDKERSKKEYEENIIQCLNWLGIEYDSGPYRQSERGDIYKKYLIKMIDDGHAYVSKEKTKSSQNEIIRFKNPNKKILFNDLVRGDIEFDTTDLKDFVIARSIDEPLYHVAVVVDDHEMSVTHVIRGEDGISNTPRQILIQEAIGASRPIYAHIPLILAPDKSKLSGRHGAISITEYKNKGYLPEAIINFLALLGFNPGTTEEIFDINKLIKDFDISEVQKSGAVFDQNKLRWFNRYYLSQLSFEEFVFKAVLFLPQWLQKDVELQNRLWPIIREKISVFGDIEELFDANGELLFVHECVDYPKELLLWKKNPNIAIAKENLLQIKNFIENIPFEDFSDKNIKNAVWSYAESRGKGDVLWPMRVALTGQEKSPDPFVSASILGKEQSLKRIVVAVTKLS